MINSQQLNKWAGAPRKVLFKFEPLSVWVITANDQLTAIDLSQLMTIHCSWVSTANDQLNNSWISGHQKRFSSTKFVPLSVWALWSNPSQQQKKSTGVITSYDQLTATGKVDTREGFEPLSVWVITALWTNPSRHIYANKSSLVWSRTQPCSF